MRQKRLIVVLCTLAIAMGLMFVTLVLASPAASVTLDTGEPAPADDNDLDPQNNGEPTGASRFPLLEQVNTQESGKIEQPGSQGNVYPLFVGVNNASIDAYTIDVNNNIFSPVFVGVMVWGSAYDPLNHRVLFNDGFTLWEWPVGGTPSLLGTIKDTGGVTLTVHGLAYYDGTLFASSITTDQIYEIDLLTLEATSIIALTDTSASISGIAADPQTGELYGTDDLSNTGLVRINLDGSLTLIAPYLDGETDVDGLAIGDGKAYLVADDDTPDYFNVFDFGTMTYTTPIVNPWIGTPGAQVGAAWISQPSISLSKTVGLDPAVCATENFIVVESGTEVTYCYEVTNDGEVTLSRHNLQDSELGQILNDFSFNLVPGATVFLTQSAVITQTTTNSAVWQAYNPGPIQLAESTAMATVVTASSTPICSSPNLDIPDNTIMGTVDTLTASEGGEIADLDIYIEATHTWVGDLTFTLENVTTGITATVIDRPGVPNSTFGCSSNNIQAVIDDEAATGIEDECDPGPIALSGSFVGGDPTDNMLMAAFDGLDIAGEWRLHVADLAGGDTGTLDTWCLLPTEAIQYIYLPLILKPN